MNRYKKANEGIHVPEEVKKRAARPGGTRSNIRWMGAAAAVLVLAVIGGAALRLGVGMPDDIPDESAEPMALINNDVPEDIEGPGNTGRGRSAGLPPDAQPFALSEAFPADGSEAKFDGDLNGFLSRSAVQLFSQAGEDNLVYSPLNVYMALAMLAESADGESRQQIVDLLEADSMEALREDAAALWQTYYLEDELGISAMAGSLWLRDGVSYNQETLDTLAEVYHASAFSGKMGAEEYNQALRSWINAMTSGELARQAEGLSFDPDTVLGLVSTLYFKGSWSDPFDPGQNTQGVFHAPSGDVEAEYMNREEVHGTYFRGEHFGAVPLGFQVWEYSMWLILPDDGYTVDDLMASGEAMEFITARKYEGYNVQAEEAIPGWPDQEYLRINLSLPKFDVSSDLDLSGALKALGVTDVFDRNVSDFTPLGVELDGPVYLSQAQHAARVTIDEEGCTAASYVDLMLVGDALPPDEVVDFTLDRPFLFAITGEGNLPLFVGVVNQPNG